MITLENQKSQQNQWFQLTGVNIHPATARVSCEHCGRKIQNEYILVGNGTIFPNSNGVMIYGGTINVGSECAKSILNNPKFETQIKDIDKLYKKMQRIQSTPGTAFSLDGTAQEPQIRLREKVNGRMIRTPYPITLDQLTFLESKLGFKIEHSKTYFLSQLEL